MSSTLGRIAAVPTRINAQIGALRSLLDNPVDALPDAVFEQRIVERHLIRQHIVYVCAPDLVREALVTRSQSLDKGEGLRRAIGPGLGEGLLTAEGDHWRWQRQALAPVFRPSGTAAFLPAMYNAATRCIDDLIGSGEAVAIDQVMMRLTGRIIVETMLSDPEAVDADRLANGLATFLKQTRWSLLGDVLGTPEWMPHPGKSRGLRAARLLREEALAQIALRRGGLASPGAAAHGTADDLLARLLGARDPETGRNMRDDEIVDNLLTFLTAGHETTALALAWTLDRIGRHPEILRAVQAEIDTVLGASGAGDPPSDTTGNTIDCPLTMAQIGRLVLTRSVLRESMRLTPPAPIIIREVREGFALDGIALSRGTRLVVPIYAIHRHRGLWHSPDVFDPSRFGDKEGAAPPIDRYAYLPFGAGHRVCIGAHFAETEALVVLALMLHRLTLTPLLRETPPGRMEITYRPARPLLMSAHRR